MNLSLKMMTKVLKRNIDESVPIFTQELNPHDLELLPVEVAVGQFFLRNLK